MFNSIRTRLTLWYVGFLALVIVIFGVAAYQFTIGALDRDLNGRLQEMALNFSNDIHAEADEERAADHDRIITQSVKESQFRDYQFAVLSETRPFIASTTEFDVRKIVLSGEKISEIKLGETSYRVYESSLELKKDRYRLLVLHPMREQTILENSLLSVFIISAAAALFLAGIGVYFLVRQSLAPIVGMSSQAGQISAENLSERLSFKNERDEVGKLGVVINELLGRLDASFEQQRRFMADASHELRTPLAIVRGESEVALSKDDRTSKEYRESLAVVHDESKRLTKIVEDLFTLARADAGQFAAHLAPVYLDEIVSDAVRSINVLAKKRNVELSIYTEGEMPMNGDESLLRQLLLNLLDNAVKYNREGGTVSVKNTIAGNLYSIAITDTGTGIPREAKTSVFERFFRVDKARGRAVETTTSGAGLGLSIARWIAELHGGRIEITASDESGSTFTIYLPR